jgi:hypothetical protein
MDAIEVLLQAAERILAFIASTRVVALNRELGLPTLRTAHLGSTSLRGDRLERGPLRRSAP